MLFEHPYVDGNYYIAVLNIEGKKKKPNEKMKKTFYREW